MPSGKLRMSRGSAQQLLCMACCTGGTSQDGERQRDQEASSLIAVELAASLTDEHKALVLRYLGTAERFSLAEWVTLLEAFTMLSDSTVQLQGETLTLQTFYNRFVDQAYSDACIDELFAATEVSARAPAIQARYARQLYQQLRSEPSTSCMLPVRFR